MQVEIVPENIFHFYPVLNDLPLDLRGAVLAFGMPVSAEAPKTLFNESTTIESLLLLTQGSVRIIRSGKEREILLYRLQPGECCAISICHLLGDTRYRARAEVETAIEGIALPRWLFQRLMERSTQFRAMIQGSLVERFTTVIDLLEAVTSLRLDERLAEVLSSRGPILHTTHAQLANELGSVREVISRILNDFESRGLIQLERGQIRVLNTDGLIRLHESEENG